MGKAMLKRRILRSAVLVIMAAGAAGTSGLLTAGAGFAATTAPAHAMARATATARPANPTSVRCTASGHANPCWAFTQKPQDGTRYCPGEGIPLFIQGSNDNNWDCLPAGLLVEISCYYQGPPTVNGDDYQDHVIAEDGGGTVIGHIPDHFIDLGGNNPPAVHIPHC